MSTGGLGTQKLDLSNWGKGMGPPKISKVFYKQRCSTVKRELQPFATEEFLG